jgi:hypothetical protein
MFLLFSHTVVFRFENLNIIASLKMFISIELIKCFLVLLLVVLFIELVQIK